MKLLYFRIKDYRSIIDTGRCYLSTSDNITVLAGQNESGKSSVLHSLHDFWGSSLREDVLREYSDEIVYPSIEWAYSIEGKDREGIDSFFQQSKFLRIFFSKLKSITFINQFLSDSEIDFNLCSSFQNNLLQELLESYSSSRKKSEDESIIDLLKEAKLCMDARIDNDDEDDEEEEEEEEEATKEPLNPESTPSVEYLKEGYAELLSTFAEFLQDYHTPKVIFFDDFCDLLPNKINISDLKKKNTSVNGYQAVKNVENILETDFTKLDALTDARREHTQNKHTNELTANFNERWKQRISYENKTKISVKHYQGKAEDSSYLKFYIESNPGELLTPNQRSQGFKWFLSFYLHLTAESKRNESLIILFDEPGLHLHAKAQKDMISVFEELSKKHQIIYSTHSPHLINPKKLHRVRLVLNSEESGTTIEKITTNKAKNKKDALRPIIDAIGLDVAHNFSTVNSNNVILEGISDFYYFSAMKKLLDPNSDYHFVPSMGVSQAHLLMELCIGWGLNWVIIFDKKDSTKEYNKIKKQFFFDDDSKARKKLYTLEGCDGIEDAFHYKDFKQVVPELKNPSTTSLSKVAEENGGKELFGRLFLSKVEANEITKETLHTTTIERFEKVLADVRLMLSEDPI